MANTIYTPLWQDEIRLLRSTATQDLVFDLVPISLAVDIEFYALSYTWGTLNYTHEIVVNGKTFRVTLNLHDALRRVKAQLGNTLTFISKANYLWVDAICIDQHNLQERNQQVQLMRMLYEKANKIYVWLGNPENELHNGLAVQRLSQFTERHRQSMAKNIAYRPWWWPRKPSNNTGANLHTLLGDIDAHDRDVYDIEGSETHNAWLGICALWRKSWWTRTWVYQEATVPEKYTLYFIKGIGAIPREYKVIFLLGSTAFSWSNIYSAMLVADKLQSTPSLDTSFMQGAQENCRRLAELRSRRLDGKQPSLLNLLQTFRLSECQNPHDKIYAPLGLAPAAAQKNIPVDYARSIQDLYLDTIKYLITEPNHELDFLGYTLKLTPQQSSNLFVDRGSRPLASWIPAWSQALDIDPLPKTVHILTEEGRKIDPFDARGAHIFRERGNEMNCYNASAGSQLSAAIAGFTLLIKGVRCDIIADIMPLEDAAKCREKGYQWGVQSKNMYPTGETFAAAIRITNAADVQYDTLSRVRARNGSIDFAFLRQNKAELSVKENERQTNMRRALNRATKLRNICLTRQGYLGLVPQSAVVGDEIDAFLGGQVLYTLRPMGGDDERGNFTYLGECFLHGLMDGEVMRWVQDGSRIVEDLVIL